MKPLQTIISKIRSIGDISMISRTFLLKKIRVQGYIDTLNPKNNLLLHK